MLSNASTEISNTPNPSYRNLPTLRRRLATRQVKPKMRTLEISLNPLRRISTVPNDSPRRKHRVMLDQSGMTRNLTMRRTRRRRRNERRVRTAHPREMRVEQQARRTNGKRSAADQDRNLQSASPEIPQLREVRQRSERRTTRSIKKAEAKA